MLDPLWDAANCLPSLPVTSEIRSRIKDMIYGKDFSGLDQLQQQFRDDGNALGAGVMYSIIERMKGSNIPA